MPATAKYRYQWYQHIYDRFPAIVEDARKAADGLGLGELRDRIGLYAGSSGCPGGMPRYVMDAVVAANEAKVLPVAKVQDRLREVVKDIYGDGFDAAVTNTCEAGLRVAFETLFAPPTMRKGDAYRGRVLAPYGEDFEWGAAYGRAFPPRYKSLGADRSVSAGELAVEGKSLTNLDTLFVKYAGADYQVHGIREAVVPLLSRVDVDGTVGRLAAVAARHADNLTGVLVVGYDTPGYGFGAHDEAGVPVLMRRIGALAAEYDVPFLVDAAACLPVIGVSPAAAGADVMTWSMDKAGRAPISGLMIGREESMNVIRRALGVGGQRFGGTTSHSKALFSIADPGRDSIVGLTAYLEVLRDDPAKVTRPIDAFHDIVVEAFAAMEPARFRDKLIVTKSYHMGGTELNYERTWDDGGFGMPIFTMEDVFANTNPIDLATIEMGVAPATVYSGNMFLGPGLGTLDADGELIPEAARLAAKALVEAVGIVNRHAGLVD